MILPSMRPLLNRLRLQTGRLALMAVPATAVAHLSSSSKLDGTPEVQFACLCVLACGHLLPCLCPCGTGWVACVKDQGWEEYMCACECLLPMFFHPYSHSPHPSLPPLFLLLHTDRHSTALRLPRHRRRQRRGRLRPSRCLLRGKSRFGGI